MPKVISAELAHQENEEAIRDWGERKLEKFVEALQKEKIDFDIDKVQSEEEATSGHRLHNENELDVILAEAERTRRLAALKKK
jgi:hypothetical protein